MNELLNKLTSYNLLNYLLPGAIFSILADRMMLIETPDDLVPMIVWYYFVGMVISRIGSVVIEPALKRLKFVEYSDYKSYLAASKVDEKLETMVEASNTYRTVATALLVLIAISGLTSVLSSLGVNDAWKEHSLLAALMILFFLSFRKQVKFIKGRVDFHNRDQQ